MFASSHIAGCMGRDPSSHRNHERASTYTSSPASRADRLRERRNSRTCSGIGAAVGLRRPRCGWLGTGVREVCRCHICNRDGEKIAVLASIAKVKPARQASFRGAEGPLPSVGYRADEFAGGCGGLLGGQFRLGVRRLPFTCVPCALIRGLVGAVRNIVVHVVGECSAPIAITVLLLAAAISQDCAAASVCGSHFALQPLLPRGAVIGYPMSNSMTAGRSGVKHFRTQPTNGGQAHVLP